MFVFTYLAGVLATTYAVLAVALLLGRRGLLISALACYLLTAALWIGSNAAADIASTEAGVVTFSGLAFIAIGLNLVCFLVLVDVLIDARMPSRRRLLLYFGNVIPAFFSFSAYGVSSVSFPPGAPAQMVPGMLYTIGFVLILIDFAYAASRLKRALHAEQEYTRRMQLIWVITGLLATVTGLLLFDVVLPLLGEQRFYTLGPLSSLFFVLGCIYAIAKHKLIRMRLVIEVLERKVAERTRTIHQLQQEQRQLITDLSHSLQTPLAILTSKLERLERTLLHDKELESVEQSVTALSHFVQDLLNLANLDQSLQHETRERFSLSDMLLELAEEIEVIAQNCRVTHAIAQDVTVYGIEKHLREAVMNLAANAVKYMGNGKCKEIRIGLVQQNDALVISISDTGIGIPAEELPHVFARFYRGTARVYGETKGTGLGLAITKRVIEEHGGTVRVTSELGKGSTFTISLPQARF